MFDQRPVTISSRKHPQETVDEIVRSYGRVSAAFLAERYGLTPHAIQNLWGRAREAGCLPDKPVKRFDNPQFRPQPWKPRIPWQDRPMPRIARLER